MLIVGAGQAGLQLALGLQARGYGVTVMTHRTADEIRTGRVLSTQVMFAGALAHERRLGIDFWRQQAPDITDLGVSVTAPDGTRAVDWLGRLEGAAQSVDQRVKMAGWLETFAERGGKVVVHAAAVSDLDYFSRAYDLVLVAAGRGEPAAMFGRDPDRSPYRAPQRALAVCYVHGLRPRPEHPDTRALHCNLVPSVGEFFAIPALTTSGPCDILFWEALPGGPADVFTGVRDPRQHLRLTLDLMRRHVPWEHARASEVELTDVGGTLTGRVTPVVRHPVAELPSGGLVLGVGDVVVANDPVTGQGANNAARCAAVHLERIIAHGDRPFDRAWMQGTFDRYWALAAPATRWTHAMLAPPPDHVLELLRAAGELQPVADRFAGGFDEPADFEGWFYDAASARAYLARVREAAETGTAGEARGAGKAGGAPAAG